VPRVVGKKLAAAKLALKAKHCGTGTVTKAYSKRIRKGRVTSQSRRAGQVLAAGTKVNLVVSKGRRR
jgi:beta-lactam-binding protein with PASTA domain